MLQVNNLGHHFSHGKGFVIHREYGSGDYLLLLFKTATHMIWNGTEIFVPENSVMLYQKGTAQHYFSADAPFVNDFVHFDGAEAQAYLQRLKIPLDTPVKLGNPSIVSRMIKTLTNEKHAGSIYEAELSDAYLRCLLLRLSEMLLSQNDAPLFALHFQEFRLLRADIYNFPQLAWTVALMSQKVNLSPAYFQHVYKYLFQTPCIADVISARMQRAKYHLEQTDFSIKQIAALCGYQNQEHFMRQFKAQVGVTPTQYKGSISS